MTRYALISVSDRSGIKEFASGLRNLGFTILTTSGTGRYLAEENIETLSIEDYTAQPEMLGGRVKTLHPKIHGGILARRDNSQDLKDLQEHAIASIDVVAVNLYPFEQKYSEKASASSEGTVIPEEMVEFIDIGGPTMIRAAAKNYAHVYAVIDPSDYPAVLEHLKGGEEDITLNRRLSAKVFSQLTHYNLQIAKCLSQQTETDKPFSYHSGVSLTQQQELRYGENPHQAGCLYRDMTMNTGSDWKQLQGKELSYNNILDADACFRMTRSLAESKARFTSGSLVNVIKHLSPCGVAIAENASLALQRAKQSDPRSHFGGIIGFAQTVDGDAAEECVKDFCEIIVAPGFSDEALSVFSRKKNIRLIECDLTKGPRTEIRSTLFGYVTQEIDSKNCKLDTLEVVAGDKPDAELYRELELAWGIVTHVKSNAIVIVRDGMLLGAGGGQTSRIDSVEVALMKAKAHDHDLQGAVAASDAFFPFYDSVERLANEGVRAIVTPGGSIKDPEVIAKAQELGVTLIFTPERHFKH